MPENTGQKKIVITSGEPAGIGPDVLLAAACHAHDAHLVAIGDRELLQSRAALLGLNVVLTPYSSTDPFTPHQPGRLPVIHIPLSEACKPGVLNSANASYVLAQLDQAMSLCLAGECHAMVTSPIHKGVINEAGIPFRGHTEYLGAATGGAEPLMLLQSGQLRVALATTHLPLQQVPATITQPHLTRKLQVLAECLRAQLGMHSPRITVLGLNPHAGEDGHLGLEEQNVITPVCDALRDSGLDIVGPISADTAFLPDRQAATDAYLAMYHDQGLPVLKTLGFQQTVNITLGLPILRTSVDHGTALALAGTGKAKAGSMVAAIQAAVSMPAAPASQSI